LSNIGAPYAKVGRVPVDYGVVRAINKKQTAVAMPMKQRRKVALTDGQPWRTLCKPCHSFCYKLREKEEEERHEEEEAGWCG
jgi:hypothetical protein